MSMVDQAQNAPNAFFENFWGAEDEEGMSSEEREFYLDFLEHNDKFKIEIPTYDYQVLEGKKVTLYNIKITLDNFSFVVSKRYSVFEKFKEQMHQKYKHLGLNAISFPNKTINFFNSTKIETIEKRKIGIVKCLDILSEHCKSEKHFDLLIFLELRKNYLEQQSSNKTLPQIGNYATNTQETAKLFEILDRIISNPDDTSKNLRDLQHFYQENKPKISLEIAKILLVGKRGKGLIHVCGKYDEEGDTHLVCSVGLELLHMFMDYSKCQDAETFISCFGRLNLQTIGLLKLSHHIGKKSRLCKLSAMKILDAYLKRNPTFKPKTILDNDEAIEEFHKFTLSNSNTSLKNEYYDVDDEIQNNFEIMDPGSMISPSGYLLDSRTRSPTKLNLNWIKLHVDNAIKVKVNKNSFLKIRLYTDRSLKTCLSLWKKGIDTRAILVEENSPKKMEDDTFIHYSKISFVKDNIKNLIFISETKIDKSTDSISIVQKPSQDYSVLLNSNEVIGKRYLSIEMKSVQESGKTQTKLKIIIKNMDDFSKLLQKMLVEPREDGREPLVVEGCKLFLSELEKKK